MARITFSLPDEIAALARRRAADDRRSLSAHLAILVENDARGAGISSDAQMPRLVVAAQELGTAKALRLLISAKRRRKTAAVKKAA